VSGPLAGVRVLDFSAVISGPMAAGWLCDQGADVTKIEPPSRDPIRRFGPWAGDISPAYLAVNRGKRHLTMDLKSPQARAVLDPLIAEADVLVENFRPGVMDKLGFGWERLQALNPRLIYCSITGYGPDGPYAGLRAYDPMVQASSGLAASQAGADGEPQLIRSLIVDKVTALTAAQAVTAALFARERTGEGQRVEVAMLDAALAFNWPEIMFNHGFADDQAPPSPPYGKFSRLWRTKDGKWVSLASFQDHELPAICAAVNRPDIAEDPRFRTGRERAKNIAAFGPVLAAAIAEVTADEFMDGCLRHGAGGAKVCSLDEIVDHPQVVHNRGVAIVDQPGAGRIRTARHPARFSGTPVGDPQPVGASEAP
jgi:crotonobetainyl-CoA:carnitine CoA-transferase CaiB-like acyl-CoA transferase